MHEGGDLGLTPRSSQNLDKDLHGLEPFSCGQFVHELSLRICQIKKMSMDPTSAPPHQRNFEMQNE